jgi:hypothetical protein
LEEKLSLSLCSLVENKLTDAGMAVLVEALTHENCGLTILQ